MKRNILIIITLFYSLTGLCQNLSLYEKHFYINGNDTMPYRLLLPENYNASKEYPLILFLHGAGERGRDNELQLVHGSKLFLRDDIRKNYPAIVVFPQCQPESFWSSVQFERRNDGKRGLIFTDTAAPTKSMVLLQELLNNILQNYPVDEKRVYVGGLSMGGMGTFEIVSRNPKIFAAAFPICGGGDPGTAKKLKKVDWWVFHGAKDEVVPPKYSELMVEALKKVKASVKFSLYPGVAHNSWDNAFAEPELFSWLFKQGR